MAAQEKAATIPLRDDDDDDRTVHGLIVEKPSQTVIDTSMFDVFTDFDLDLTCLSRPGSPTASTSELPPATPSPPASPPLSPILSHSISFMSQAAEPVSTTGKKSTKKKASSQQLHSQTVPSKKTSRGSWPLIKYAGRGTPIDRNRRLEWGGFSSEDVVAEDGVLFAAVRSTSLDSAIRPSIRSASPDWSTSRLASSISHSNHSVSEHHSSVSSHRLSSVDSEPPPEIAPIQGLGTDKTDEWDSIMKTVLSSSTDLQLSGEADAVADENRGNGGDSTGDTTDGGATDLANTDNADAVATQQLTPEQLAQLKNGLEIDLGLDAALDLGLGRRGGMNWFDLGLLPQSARASIRARSAASGRDSPSVYSSQAVTPRASVHEDSEERRSPTSTKADVTGAGASSRAENPGDLKFVSPSWWQKMLLRIRRVHTFIATHGHRH